MLTFRFSAQFSKLVALATLAGFTVAGGAHPAHADGFLEFGDEDRLNSGAYGTDPKSGTTLVGLSPGAVTLANNIFSNGFPFDPSVTDFTNTDQIFVGSVQTFSHDGYSAFAGRKNGPLILTLDYSSLVLPGQSVTGLTLGLAANDFQRPVFGQPFTATVNGITQTVLTNQLNAFSQTGPIGQFFTIGLDPTLDTPAHTLTVSIDEGGDGGDGFAIDFATVGVTTQGISAAAPEPVSLSLLSFALPVGAAIFRRRQKAAAKQQ